MGCFPQPDDRSATTEPQIVARGKIALDLSGLPSFKALDDQMKRERDAAFRYRKVTAADCECLAAQNADIANLLDRKAASCMQCDGGHHSNKGPSQQAILQQGVLHDVALEERIVSAGAALQLFFRLAEAEGKYDVLRRSLTEIEDALASGEEMRAKGMQLGDDFDVLRRRRVTTMGDNVKLEAGIERLNVELKQLLELGPRDERWRIWPDASWRVTQDRLDIEQAVSIGLARRPELNLLRTVAQSLNSETAPMIQSIMGQANALLGQKCAGGATKCTALKLLLEHPQANPAEVQALCRQVQAYLVQREQAVAQQIRQDAVAVGERLRLVAVGQEEVRGWEQRLAELKSKADQGMTVFPDQTTAMLHKLEAQSNLIENVMAWNIARVKLAQDQGILTEGCLAPTCPAPGP